MHKHPWRIKLTVMGSILGIAVSTSLAVSDEGSLADLLEKNRAQNKVCAMGALVIVDGKVKDKSVSGTIAHGNDTKVATDARWHLGSCTKSMTATLAAVMIQEGKLSWDLTLGEAFKDADFALHEDYKPVTLVQLLSHRAGAPNDLVKRPIFFQMIFEQDPDPVDQRLRLAKTILSAAPASKPGTEFAYANEGYIIAGHILERIGGKPCEELLIEKVFKPLGMTSAGFGPPPGDDDPRGHRAGLPQEPGPIADNPVVVGPAGRAHMTLEDWAKYTLEHLHAARGEPTILLSPESAKRLHTPPAGNYALGWGTPIVDFVDGSVLAHSGSNTMWFAEIWIVPERNFAALVTANEASEGAQKAIRDVIHTLVDQYIPPMDVVNARERGHVPMNTLAKGFTLRVRDTSDQASHDAPRYVACNDNNWNPGDPKWRMQYKDDAWELHISRSPNSERMEFKITKGSWETVEVNADLLDVVNHKVAFAAPDDENATMEIKIPAYADQRGK